MDDPDAPVGTFTHWVIFNLPPETKELTEAVPKDERLASGALHGKNGMMQLGYFGPCPPPGKPHHYNFVLYALDKKLDLAAGASKQQVLEAMQGQILGRGQLIGLYQR
jgi:Raf kinase inhibitor-like YbhB/YbcL family protein